MSPKDAIQLANDRPSSVNDDLYQWAIDAEEALREMADRVVKYNDEMLRYRAFRLDVKGLIDATEP